MHFTPEAPIAPAFYSRKQFAVRIGRSERALDSALIRKTIPIDPVIVAGKKAYLVSEVEAYIARLAETSRASASSPTARAKNAATARAAKLARRGDSAATGAQAGGAQC